MKVSDLLKEEFEPLTVPDPDRDIQGVYIGDLLSWVMGRAKADNAWITIMSNINVVAVASLADTAVVILTEGVVLEDEVLKAAEDRNVNIVSTVLSTYEAAVRLSGLLS